MDIMAVFGSLLLVCTGVFAGRYLVFKSRNSSKPSGISGFKMFGFFFVLGGFLGIFLLVSALLLTFYEGQFGFLTVCAKSVFKLGLFSAIVPFAIAYLIVNRLSLYFDRLIKRRGEKSPM
ncbi:MAG: hypothetical protein V1690_02070 [Candidatus Moraniibacteriota bacterium]